MFLFVVCCIEKVVYLTKTIEQFLKARKDINKVGIAIMFSILGKLSASGRKQQLLINN